MSQYRNALPQLGDRPFITDGGLETTLIYHDGLDLPHFAAFVLLDDPARKAKLDRYFERYAEIGRTNDAGVVLETATWRANPDWAAKLGYDAEALARIHRASVDQLLAIRARFETPRAPIVVSGNLGPRGDGYRPDARMSADEAAAYHGPQIRTFAATDADMVAAFTMNYPEEAIGIASAAKASGMPVAISFTVETDGRLPSGDSLADAIARTDDATDRHPAYYMINCAHPSHFRGVLDGGGTWRERIRGIRANASKRSHAELDAATELDIGDIAELARDYRALHEVLPRLAVVGGCCGTDHRHVEAICGATRAAIAR
jgi:S-methylmethionine-dependent homocysteine/selenocysteine methylase